ncbi:MAG TPA: N(4)-(beta-N-acetylglucosaminyl)-L-asparaginase [Gemmatimonadaceae bacterium]|nr:N(4)-(beta-N-acetylglucosaminyl)-L-asparaginase [Gemmatimonadaceae bacterium]
MSISRRTFIGTGAAAAAGLTLVPTAAEAAERLVALGGAPGILRSKGRPCVVASANGIRGVAVAYDQIKAGADPLDAVIAGVNIQELDPEDQSVGIGGLPNEEGVVQLDASCMHGPTKRAGAVGALEDIATPSLVAKAIMDYTNHIFLVGAGAKKFALEMGFKETNLLTEKSRQDWLRWKANLNANDNWLDHSDDVKIKFTTGTIPMLGVTAGGDIASVVTTSGLSWKIPGRVGDSGVVGAGQYCDNAVGAAGSTGRGESNIKICGAYYIVELMRQGMAPQQACMKALERVVETTEARLLDGNGRPKIDLEYYAVAKDGSYGASTMYEGRKFAVCDANGARLEECAYLYRKELRPK